MAFVAADTNAPDVLKFSSENEEKTAVYMLGWVNARGGKRPWSAIVAATVAD